MGCVEILPWERLVFPAAPADAEAAHTLSRMLPGPIFALETGGTPIARFPFPSRGVLIAGSEELGVSPGALAAADASLGRLSIPTRGAKGSLNVSVAFGIAMAAWAFKLEAGT
jgi:TrmH family RNA methyltransferase